PIGLLDEAFRLEGRAVDDFARGEFGLYLLEIDDLPVLLERGVGESAVREAPVQGHLAALEAGIGLPARPRLLAFVAFARGGAQPGALAPAHPARLLRCALGRVEVEVGHHSISLTSTR